jgi:hypothetical protein
MPAGVSYDLIPEAASPEVCNVASIYRLAGGFNLEDAALVAGTSLPPLAPLAVNFATRKAVAVKSVVVQANAAANATAIRIKKGSLAYKDMFIGNGTVSKQVTAIDKTNAAYDVLTVTLTAAVTAGDSLFETANGTATTPKNTANLLNYAAVKVETGESVTAIGQVFEIVEANLSLPLAAADKVNLGSRFMFV